MCLLSGIIYIADILDLQTVCEGVENEEQKNVLVHLGCRYAQGYYFAKPMRFSQLETMLLGEIIGSEKETDKICQENNLDS